MRLLIVDDDANVRESLVDALQQPGREIQAAEDGEGALELLERSPADLVITDVRMPGISGLDLLQEIQRRRPGADVLLITAYDDMDTVVEAMREGAREFLVKPLDLRELRALVDRFLSERRMPSAQQNGGSDVSPTEPAQEEAANGAQAEDAPAEKSPPTGGRDDGPALARLVGRDSRMIEVFKLLGQAAASGVNVLIRGESGTGKELVARALHDSSSQASEPFVPVNCTAIPAALLESELFGHVKGSFTGATADRKGRFAAAGRGTIFLDEVGDTPEEFQAKLLRVLQEQEFYPVGADRPQRTDARVVAATHRDLEAAAREGQFRADLYYRLRVLEIRIPPLRERPSDIPDLAHHLLDRISRRLGERRPTLSEEAMRTLQGHDWPGNVRELENCLQRAMVMATGEVIHPGHLDLGRNPAPQEGTAYSTLAEVEGDHVRRVLEATDWHKARTAEILDISRPRLNRLIQRHGLA